MCAHGSGGYSQKEEKSALILFTHYIIYRKSNFRSQRVFKIRHSQEVKSGVNHIAADCFWGSERGVTFNTFYFFDTVPYVHYRCSKPGSSPFGGIQLASCAFCPTCTSSVVAILGRKSVVSAKNVVLNEIFSTKNLGVWKIKGIFAFIFDKSAYASVLCTMLCIVFYAYTDFAKKQKIL